MYVEFCMSESKSVSLVEEEDKINPKDLGKIGNALARHFAKYSDLLITPPEYRKDIPRVEDL